MKPSDSKPDDGPPPVDFSQLQSACDGDTVMMRELMDLYFHQADDIMAHLDQAIKSNAVGDVNHLAHKLAGSSLACGMSAVVPSLRQLEGGAKAGHLNGAPELLSDVSARMKVVRGCVQDYLVQIGAPNQGS